MRRTSLVLLTALALVSGIAGEGAAAQDAAEPVTVAAGGLVNPRGFAWDAAGALVVAEAGTGGETTSDEVAPPTGPYRGGQTARVKTIVAEAH